jgi:hypothetical protein
MSVSRAMGGWSQPYLGNLRIHKILSHIFFCESQTFPNSSLPQFDFRYSPQAVEIQFCKYNWCIVFMEDSALGAVLCQLMTLLGWEKRVTLFCSRYHQTSLFFLNWHSIPSASIPCLIQPLVTTVPSSFYINLTILGTLHKWSVLLSGLLYLVWHLQVLPVL